MVVNGGFENPW